MDYQRALAYLYSFADFERGGTFARDPERNLPRMRALLALLGDPHQAAPLIHIAGTKGKGSTAALIAAALTASGQDVASRGGASRDLRVGFYSQPDLHTFRERVRVDGVPLSEALTAELITEIAAAVARLPAADRARVITYELSTALAFLAFARLGVAVGVVEVGLGGRLDATNVINPLVGVITSISLDHMAVLGDTIAAIAREKAGIIKPGLTVVTSARHPAALAEITAACAARAARLIRVGPATDRDAAYRYEEATARPTATVADLAPPPFTVHTPSGARQIQIGLLGAHQRENATAGLAALDALRAREVVVTEGGIQAGLRSARWPGRMQPVATAPWLVVDGAHNADSLARLLTALPMTFAFRRLILALGTMRDKDLPGMIAAIVAATPRPALIVTARVVSPRAWPADELAAALAPALPGIAVRAARSVAGALSDVLAEAGPDDLVCVAGSLYLAAAALRWAKTHRSGPLTAAIEIDGDDHAGD